MESGRASSTSGPKGGRSADVSRSTSSFVDSNVTTDGDCSTDINSETIVTSSDSISGTGPLRHLNFNQRTACVVGQPYGNNSNVISGNPSVVRQTHGKQTNSAAISASVAAKLHDCSSIYTPINCSVKDQHYENNAYSTPGGNAIRKFQCASATQSQETVSDGIVNQLLSLRHDQMSWFTLKVLITRDYPDSYLVKTKDTTIQANDSMIQMFKAEDDKRQRDVRMTESDVLDKYKTELQPMKRYNLDLLKVTTNWEMVRGVEDELTCFAFHENRDLVESIMSNVPNHIKESVLDRCNKLRESLDLIYGMAMQQKIDDVSFVKSFRKIGIAKGVVVSSSDNLITEIEVEIVLHDAMPQFHFAEGSLYEIRNFKVNQTNEPWRIDCARPFEVVKLEISELNEDISRLARMYVSVGSMTDEGFSPPHNEVDVIGSVRSVVRSNIYWMVELLDEQINLFQINFVPLIWTTKACQTFKCGNQVFVKNLKFNKTEFKETRILTATSQTLFGIV